MLVLSRKQQEQIKIGDQITVTIVRVKGNTVRVGIEAPRDVRVIRGELPKLDDGAESVAVEGLVDASEDRLEQNEGVPSGSIVSFRVCCECTDDVPSKGGALKAPVTGITAETPANRLAHLPPKRLRDRFGNAPLKQVLASSGTLAK